MSTFQRLVLLLLAVSVVMVWVILVLYLVNRNQDPAFVPAIAESNPDPGGSGQVALVVAGMPATLPPTWTRPASPQPVTPSLPPPTLTPTPSPPSPPIHRPTAVTITSTYNHPSSTLAIPTAVPTQAIRDDAITILLLGSDQRPDWEDWHTDAVQYVVIYPDVPAASILSIPRDLYVYIPNFWMSRINFADMYGETASFDGGGLGLLNQTLLHNLGISADYYAKVDFDGLIGLIDTIGGIDVPVHCQIQDFWPYPNEQGEYYYISLEPGIQHMDGELALWYSRSRKTTSVFSRERRQQQVLEAMWRRARQENLFEKIPALYEQSSDLFETDLGLTDILALGLTAAQLDSVNIKRRSIGWGQVLPYTTPYGGGVYLPVWSKVQPVVADVLSPPATNRATQDPIWVEIWNGTEHGDWDYLAADRLYRNGFMPIIGTPDRRDYAETEIIFFGDSIKGSGLSGLQSLFQVREEELTHRPENSPSAPLRLIIGGDYATCPEN